MIELSVIICNYLKFDLLKQTLNSLLAANISEQIEIIVTDNSPQPPEEELKTSFPQVKFIFNRQNLGFGAACNRAFKKAQGDYVAFVNNDIVVFPDTLNTLLEQIKSDSTCGAIGPLVINPGNRLELSFARKSTLFYEFYQKFFRQAIWQKRYLLGQLTVSEWDWLSGCFLMIRRDLFTTELPFDEKFFLYFEDQDLCLRVRAKGKKVIFFPLSMVSHLHNQTLQDFSLLATLEYRRSQLYFYRKWNSRWQLILLKFYLLLKFGQKALFARKNSPAREIFSSLKQTIREA